MNGFANMNSTCRAGNRSQQTPRMHEDVGREDIVRQPQNNDGDDNACWDRDRDIYGSVYNIGAQDVVVPMPGDTASVVFSNNAVLSRGIVHKPGEAAVTVRKDGNYEITFTLYFTASVSSFATFAIEADGVRLPGATYGRTLDTGYQMLTGQTIAPLNGGDSIRIILTSAIAFGITLTGADVTATLTVKKLD